MKTPKKKLKLGRWILLALLIFCIYLFTRPITLNAKITIESGDNVSKIFKQLSAFEQFRMKRYLFTHRSISFSKLEVGNYTFSGDYTQSDFIANILQGSEKDYLRLTILEGRSIYDIDESLSRKGYIITGAFIAYTTNPDTIAKYQETYAFLLISTPKSLKTLEGFLYPDTYNIDKNKELIPQLVNKQLQTFNTRVRGKLSTPIDWYKIVILASILEKEERNIANKTTVAGIFLKRLEIGMKIDADITLCYGLKSSYTTCTPTIIAKYINDSTNIYNTRQVRGLPLTPIANPTRESINAILYPKYSDYLYYLHDMQGNIHYGRTLEEHNMNKQQYLR